MHAGGHARGDDGLGDIADEERAHDADRGADRHAGDDREPRDAHEVDDEHATDEGCDEQRPEGDLGGEPLDDPAGDEGAGDEPDEEPARRAGEHPEAGRAAGEDREAHEAEGDVDRHGEGALARAEDRPGEHDAEGLQRDRHTEAERDRTRQRQRRDECGEDGDLGEVAGGVPACGGCRGSVAGV